MGLFKDSTKLTKLKDDCSDRLDEYRILSIQRIKSSFLPHIRIFLSNENEENIFQYKFLQITTFEINILHGLVGNISQKINKERK